MFSYLWIIPVAVFSQPQSDKKGLDYPPLIERYIFDELKSLRADQMKLRNDVIREMTERELSAADRTMSYSINVVTYFFYLVVGVVSLLALVGWQSLRDVKQNVRVLADRELARLTMEYETRLSSLEIELRAKSEQILDNQREIENTQKVHSLWMQSTQEPEPANKVEILDKILGIRPDDPEAMVYKADAVIQMGQLEWAISLCNRILEISPDNSLALYQRACAYSGLGHFDEALNDLTGALESSDTLREQAREDEALLPLRDNERFIELMGES